MTEIYSKIKSISMNFNQSTSRKNKLFYRKIKCNKRSDK